MWKYFQNGFLHVDNQVLVVHTKHITCCNVDDVDNDDNKDNDDLDEEEEEEEEKEERE